MKVSPHFPHFTLHVSYILLLLSQHHTHRHIHRMSTKPLIAYSEYMPIENRSWLLSHQSPVGRFEPWAQEAEVSGYVRVAHELRGAKPGLSMVASPATLPPASGCGDRHCFPWPGCSCSRSHMQHDAPAMRESTRVETVCADPARVGLYTWVFFLALSQHQPVGGWKAQGPGLATLLSCTVWLTRHMSGPR